MILGSLGQLLGELMANRRSQALSQTPPIFTDTHVQGGIGLTVQQLDTELLVCGGLLGSNSP